MRNIVRCNLSTGQLERQREAAFMVLYCLLFADTTIAVFPEGISNNGAVANATSGGYFSVREY